MMFVIYPQEMQKEKNKKTHVSHVWIEQMWVHVNKD
jgi:hypothetical protein